VYHVTRQNLIFDQDPSPVEKWFPRAWNTECRKCGHYARCSWRSSVTWRPTASTKRCCVRKTTSRKTISSFCITICFSNGCRRRSVVTTPVTVSYYVPILTGSWSYIQGGSKKLAHFYTPHDFVIYW